MDAEQAIQTVVDNVLLRGREEVQLELQSPHPKQAGCTAWDSAAEQEKNRAGYFTQHGSQPDEVARERRRADCVWHSPGPQ
jgi:hypothetical protein